MGEYLEKYNKKMLDIDLLDLTFNEIYETAYFYWYNGVRYRCFEPDIEIVSYNLVVEFIKAGFGIGYVTKEFIKQELKNKRQKSMTKLIGISLGVLAIIAVVVVAWIIKS